jgi:hypothetical protein
VSRWRNRERQQGVGRGPQVRPDRGAQGNDPGHAEAIEELRRRLAEKGLVLGEGTIRGFFERQQSPAKKTAHAIERPDVVKRRQDWIEGQPSLDPGRLVFIDETWASTNMARRYGRCPRGEGLRASVPHGHWKTFVAGLTTRGAPWVLDGPSTAMHSKLMSRRSSSLSYEPGDTVIMDSSSSHKAGASDDPDRWRKLALSAALQPYLNPSRMPSPSSRRSCPKPPNDRSMGSGAPSPHHQLVHPNRMQTLRRCGRMRCNLIGDCSRPLEFSRLPICDYPHRYIRILVVEKLKRIKL